MFAAAGDADFGMWMEERKRQRTFKQALRSQLIAVL